jgi:hypothetical protein
VVEKSGSELTLGRNYLIARMTKDIADRTSHEKISHDEAASQGSALPAGL